MPHPLTGRHLINGQWHNSPNTFTAHNPSTGDKLTPPASEAGKIEAERALAAAAESHAMTQDFPYDWPAKFLDALADEIMGLGDELLDRAERETALPRARLTGERTRTVNQLKLFADVVRDGSWVNATIDTADPSRQPAPKPDVRKMLRPRGPVVVFSASNFPFAFGVLGGDTAAAIAAGCPVVVKAHPSHPGTSELFAAAALAAIEGLNLPRGLFAVLQGTTKDLGAALVNHPFTTAVAFTGSQKAGRALFDLAAKRDFPIPVFAEMGSVNPLVITANALRERSDAIAKDLAGSILLGGGQFCTKPGLILPIGDAAPHFIEQLKSHLAAAQNVTMLNQGLRNAFTEKTESFTKVKGVTPHLTPAPSAHAATSVGLLEVDPETFANNETLQEEAFGPAAVVVPCRELHDAVMCARALAGSLTATVHLGSNERPSTTTPLLRALEGIAGRLIVNGYPTGVEVTHAMVHGGPYPATTDPATTSVGTAALLRFTRPVAFQTVPNHLLPPALQNENPLNLSRVVNGKRTTDPIA